jgi:hypothetical protein
MLAFLSLLAALVLAEIALHLVIALRDPKDARTPKDERDTVLAAIISAELVKFATQIALYRRDA